MSQNYFPMGDEEEEHSEHSEDSQPPSPILFPRMWGPEPSYMPDTPPWSSQAPPYADVYVPPSPGYSPTSPRYCAETPTRSPTIILISDSEDDQMPELQLDLDSSSSSSSMVDEEGSAQVLQFNHRQYVKKISVLDWKVQNPVCAYPDHLQTELDDHKHYVYGTYVHIQKQNSPNYVGTIEGYSTDKNTKELVWHIHPYGISAPEHIEYVPDRYVRAISSDIKPPRPLFPSHFYSQEPTFHPVPSNPLCAKLYFLTPQKNYLWKYAPSSPWKTFHDMEFRSTWMELERLVEIGDLSSCWLDIFRYTVGMFHFVFCTDASKERFEVQLYLPSSKKGSRACAFGEMTVPKQEIPEKVDAVAYLMSFLFPESLSEAVEGTLHSLVSYQSPAKSLEQLLYQTEHLQKYLYPKEKVLAFDQDLMVRFALRQETSTQHFSDALWVTHKHRNGRSFFYAPKLGLVQWEIPTLFRGGWLFHDKMESLQKSTAYLLMANSLFRPCPPSNQIHELCTLNFMGFLQDDQKEREHKEQEQKESKAKLTMIPNHAFGLLSLRKYKYLHSQFNSDLSLALGAKNPSFFENIPIRLTPMIRAGNSRSSNDSIFTVWNQKVIPTTLILVPDVKIAEQWNQSLSEHSNGSLRTYVVFDIHHLPFEESGPLLDVVLLPVPLLRQLYQSKQETASDRFDPFKRTFVEKYFWYRLLYVDYEMEDPPSFMGQICAAYKWVFAKKPTETLLQCAPLFGVHPCSVSSLRTLLLYGGLHLPSHIAYQDKIYYAQLCAHNLLYQPIHIQQKQMYEKMQSAIQYLLQKRKNVNPNTFLSREMAERVFSLLLNSTARRGNTSTMGDFLRQLFYGHDQEAKEYLLQSYFPLLKNGKDGPYFSENNTCGICLIRRPYTQFRYLEHCGHMFCEKCIRNCFQCPFCKSSSIMSHRISDDAAFFRQLEQNGESVDGLMSLEQDQILLHFREKYDWVIGKIHLSRVEIEELVFLLFPNIETRDYCIRELENRGLVTPIEAVDSKQEQKMEWRKGKFYVGLESQVDQDIPNRGIHIYFFPPKQKIIPQNGLRVIVLYAENTIEERLLNVDHSHSAFYVQKDPVDISSLFALLDAPSDAVVKRVLSLMFGNNVLQ